MSNMKMRLFIKTAFRNSLITYVFSLSMLLAESISIGSFQIDVILYQTSKFNLQKN